MTDDSAQDGVPDTDSDPTHIDPAGALADLLRRYLNVVAESDRNFPVKGVDEEFKKLILMDFIVCLLGTGHTFHKQTSQLTSFVKY